uniref:GAG-pre-integrase domain-containing protein n=1 Tax=Cajanus cajan TaxID=3821 RepID=A0A151TDS6_CAJCA|nr:hypothetical protein KK1_011425 [Cajanus cajan]
MIGNQPLFLHLSFSGSLPFVTLANGSKIKVCGIKHTPSLPNLLLHFILFVHGFSSNSIFISKLTCNHDYDVLIVNNFVLVYDRHTRLTIRARHESRGLYQFSPLVAYVLTTTHILVHQRLGHPSMDELRLLVPSLSTLTFS